MGLSERVRTTIGSNSGLPFGFLAIYGNRDYHRECSKAEWLSERLPAKGRCPLNRCALIPN
jgi:hypothetical protein